jgi:hypothetical protein
MKRDEIEEIDQREREIQKEERVKLLLEGMLHKNFCPVIYVQYQPRGSAW